MNITIANEYGKGLGHLSRLLALANRLIKAGHAVQIMCHDLHLLNQFSNQEYDLDIIPSPTRAYGQHVLGGTKVQIASHLDKLAVLGFNQEDTLKYFLKSYQVLLRHHQPDLIIVDSAPVLQFYAYALGIPLIELGDAFDIPVMTNGTFPRYLISKPLMHIDDLMRTMVAGLNYLNGCVDFDLNDYVYSASQFIIHHPDLDPLQSYRKNVVYRSFYQSSVLLPKIYKTELHIFIYLSKQTPNIDRLLIVLQKMCFTGHIYIPYATLAQQHFLQAIGFTVYTTYPTNLCDLIETAQLVIHIGGAFITNFCLTHRIPQLILPLSLKSVHYARRIKALEVGDYSDLGDLSIAQICIRLKQFLNYNFTGMMDNIGFTRFKQATQDLPLIDLIPQLINAGQFK